jgi:di/tricarboxylate transporter
MAGLMGVTAFLSMWINNSAATSIMIPAAIGIVEEFQNHQEEIEKRHVSHENGNRRKSKEIIPVESTSTNFFILIISIDNRYLYL